MTSDWDHLDQARNGQENAWRLLFHRHHPSLLRMTTLITGSPDRGQDIVQETFIRLLNSRVKHHQGSFRSYLSTIAYRLALKEKKQMNRRISQTISPRMAEESPTALESIIRKDRDKQIYQVIRTLPKNQMNILILRFYGGHTYEEIARITETPLGTVKSRIFYGVKTCRKYLLNSGVI